MVALAGIILNMILVSHVLIAVGSVVYTTYLYLRPTADGLKLAYAFVAATLSSGIYLVWNTKSPLLQACTTGLLYLAVVSVGIALAHKKLISSDTNR